MANFIVVVDPDTKRRTYFVKAIEPLLSAVDSLLADSCSTENFCAVWSAQARAPVSKIADDKGAAVLFGDAINKPHSDRMDAASLRILWNDSEHRSKAAFDGFYAGIVYHQQSGLIAGADLLGIFPLYYWAEGSILLVGSSPELFKHHPSFRAEFNPSGFLAVALISNIFDGQTLLRKVRRLTAGHLLLWQPTKPAKELLQYSLPVSQNYFSLPFSAHVDILDQAIDKTIDRHIAAREHYGLMLSGGLDSRMLAGYLNKKRINTKALTLGAPTDLEMRCAARVAKTLSLPQHAIDIPFDQYPLCAELQAKWEHVAAGFNNIFNWALHSYVRNLPPRIVMGHTIDAVVGTRYINWAYSPTTNEMCFDTFFANLNKWAIHPDTLRKLLLPEVFGDLLEQTIARIKAVYQSYSELESQRAWCFNLYNRQRFHVASAAWPLSFGAWPIIFSLDHNLLETAAAMPAATIAERRAEVQLLSKRFPRLAQLPLDRNSYNTEPLCPPLRCQLAKYLYNHLRPLHRLRNALKNGKPEQRYYVRIYDFNNPGWLAVRRQAEPFRKRLFHIFNKDVLNELLPAPDVPVTFKNKIAQASGLKILLGFMLWSKDHPI